MKKNFKNTFIKLLNSLAIGVFSTLLIGLILKQFGTLLGLEFLVVLGNIAQRLMGPGIGIAIAHSLNANPLALVSCAVVGALGAGSVDFTNYTLTIGEPVGAFAASIISAMAGNFIYKKTKVDILVVPSITLIVGFFAAKFISPTMSYLMTSLGMLINKMTLLKPLPMGILVSASMGIILTLPISSAAIAISLKLSGLAAGAATAGCAANMIGFAVAGYRDNKKATAVAVGLGTSMLHISNIVKNPWIWLPAIISSIITGPISTVILKLSSNPQGAGMGTSGMVGPLMMIETMGYSNELMLKIILLHFILPAIISYICYKFLLAKGKIKLNDYKLEQ